MTNTPPASSVVQDGEPGTLRPAALPAGKGLSLKRVKPVEPSLISPDDDMLDGYRAGFTDERAEYPTHSNRSEAYKHGWLNGRDDRLNDPRDTAASIRAIQQDIEQRRERIARRLEP